MTYSSKKTHFPPTFLRNDIHYLIFYQTWAFIFFELPASRTGVLVPGKHTHVVTQEEGHPGGFRGHRELANPCLPPCADCMSSFLSDI